MITPHPFQLEVIEGVRQAMRRGKRRPILVAVTGSGKTVMGSAIIKSAVDLGSRVIFLVHRRELVKQTADKLHRNGVEFGIIAAGFPAHPDKPVQIVMAQTLHARAIRGARLELPSADLIMIDECHRAGAQTWREIVEAFPDARVVGLTATPARGDGKGLGDIFDELVIGPSVKELVRLGHLAPIARIYGPVPADIANGVRTRGGDFVESELAAVMNTVELVGDIPTTWHRLGQRRPTIVFAVDVKHSLHIRDRFREAGVLAEHIDGDTPAEERDAILAAFLAGKVEVVTNCMVLTEGTDLPPASCCVLARPTKSLVLYKQMTGRVMRTSPETGKTDAIVLDHAGIVGNLGFPDDDIEWTLTTGKKAVNRDHRARQEGRKRGIVTCPECSAFREEGAPCSACGWAPRKKGEPIETRDGDLGLISRSRKVNAADMTWGQRQRFYFELLGINREHEGWKYPGWASAKYRERFGEWPPRDFEEVPALPSTETRSWVKSRMIAWARSKRRQAAA
jgi:superfamily II DNA or RNA helicase